MILKELASLQCAEDTFVSALTIVLTGITKARASGTTSLMDKMPLSF